MPQLDRLNEIVSLLERGEIDRATFLDQFVRYLAAAIGCSRAGVWMFLDTGGERVSRCLAMYDAQNDLVVGATDMVYSDVRPYFDALMRDGCVVATDARSHPATSVFLDEYLLPLDVFSLMDVCFSVNGQLFGTFSCEQVGATMQWTPAQLQLLRQVASRASLTLMRAASAEIDTGPAALWEPTTPSRLTGRRSSDKR